MPYILTGKKSRLLGALPGRIGIDIDRPRPPIIDPDIIDPPIVIDPDIIDPGIIDDSTKTKYDNRDLDILIRGRRPGIIEPGIIDPPIVIDPDIIDPGIIEPPITRPFDPRGGLIIHDRPPGGLPDVTIIDPPVIARPPTGSGTQAGGGFIDLRPIIISTPGERATDPSAVQTAGIPGWAKLAMAGVLLAMLIGGDKPKIKRRRRR